MSDAIHGFLYLVWKDPKNRRNYIVGKLTKEDSYHFEYCGDWKQAKEAGWEYLKSFPEEKEYESPVLFAAFASRLPDPKRKGIEAILKKYGLAEYDGYELLRKSTGRLPIDTYEFIDPIFPEDQTIIREFYVVGIRHNSTCEGIECNRLPKIEVGDELVLVPEPENEYDRYAIKVHTKHGEMLGYVPRYYSEGVSERLSHGMTYVCEIVEIDQTRACESCLKVRLRIPREQ